MRRNFLASVLSLVILFMGSAAWAQSLTQQVVRHCSTTLPVTFSGGEAAVLLIGFFRNVPVSFKVTDNNGGTWQEAPNYPAGGPSDRGRMTYDIWVSFNHPAGSTTITAQTTNNPPFPFTNASLDVFSGVSGPIDVVAINAAQNEDDTETFTPRTGILTTTFPHDLIVGGAYNDDGHFGDINKVIDYGAGGGTPTLLTENEDCNGSGNLESAYQTATANGSYGFQFNTFGSNSDVIGGAVALEVGGTNIPPVAPTCTCPSGYTLNQNNMCIYTGTP